MNENVFKDVDPEELAMKLNISYSWFRKVFKDYTGYAPAKYFQELKLRKATPAVAKIKWILRGPDNVERDYMIASCPFILAVDKIYDKIRNLKYRYINPEYKTLFPEEIDTYEVRTS